MNNKKNTSKTSIGMGLAITGVLLIGAAVVLIPRLAKKSSLQNAGNTPAEAATEPAEAVEAATDPKVAEVAATPKAPAAKTKNAASPEKKAEPAPEKKPEAKKDVAAVAGGDGPWVIHLKTHRGDFDEKTKGVVMQIAAALKRNNGPRTVFTGINNSKKSSKPATSAATKISKAVRELQWMPDKRIIIETDQTPDTKGILVKVQMAGGK